VLAERQRTERARGVEERPKSTKLRNRQVEPMKLAMHAGFVSGLDLPGARRAGAQVRREDGVAEVAHRPLGERLRGSEPFAGLVFADEYDAHTGPARAKSVRDGVRVELALVEDDHVCGVPFDETLGAADALRELHEQPGPREKEVRELEEAGVGRRDQDTYECRALCRDFGASSFGREREAIAAVAVASSHESTAALDLSVGVSRGPGSDGEVIP
jgi:hypothetical protein